MALTDRRVAQTLLEFKVMQSDLNAARRSIATLEKGYAELESAAKDADASMSRQSSRLAAIASVTRAQAIPAIDDLRDSIEGLNDAEEKAAATSGRAGGLGGIQRFGRLAANVPGLEGVAGGFNVADDILDAKQALSALSPAALGASAAFAGLGLGLAALNAALEPGRQATQAYIGAVEGLNAAIVSGTTDVIAAERKRVQDEITLEGIRERLFQQKIDALIQENNGFKSALDSLLGTSTGLQVATTANIEGYGDLQNALKESQARSAELQQELDLLGQVAGSDTIALNDAAEAEKQRTEAIQAYLDRVAQTEIDTLVQYSNASSKAIQDRVNANNTELEIIRQHIEAGDLSAEMTQRLIERQDALIEQNGVLLTQSLGLAQAREVEAEAARIQAEKEKLLADSRAQAAEDAAKAVQDLRKVEAEITDIQTKMDEKLTAIADAFGEKVAELEAARNEAIADAEKEATEAETEARDKANADEQKAQAEHYKNLRRIQREFLTSREQAIQDRDAIALDRARETYKQQLNDENDSYKERRQAVDDELKNTLRQIDKRLKDQTALAQKRYDEQYRAAYNAASKQRSLEMARFQQELADKQAEANLLHQQLIQYNAIQLGIGKDGANQLIAVHRAMWQQLVADASGGSLASGKPIAGAGGSGGPVLPPKFQGGAYITRGMGGINISISGMGMGERQIEQKVIATLRAGFREARKN